MGGYVQYAPSSRLYALLFSDTYLFDEFYIKISVLNDLTSPK